MSKDSADFAVFADVFSPSSLLGQNRVPQIRKIRENRTPLLLSSRAAARDLFSVPVGSRGDSSPRLPAGAGLRGQGLGMTMGFTGRGHGSRHSRVFRAICSLEPPSEGSLWLSADLSLFFNCLGGGRKLFQVTLVRKATHASKRYFHKRHEPVVPTIVVRCQ